MSQSPFIWIPTRIGAVLPEVQHILPDLAAALSNQIVMAQNSSYPRTCLLREASANNWDNPMFLAMVKFAADILALFIRTNQFQDYNYNYLPSTVAFREAIETATANFASELVISRQDIAAYVDPNQINIARQNCDQYRQQLAQIQQMYQYGSQPTYGAAQYPTTAGVAPGYPAPYAARPPTQSYVEQYGRYPAAGMVTTTPGVDDSRYQRQMPIIPPPAAVAPPVAAVPVPPPVTKVTSADWVATRSAPYRVLPHALSQQEEFVCEGQTVSQVLTHQEVPVEREKHTIIGKLKVRNSPLYKATTATDVDEMARITANDISQAHRGVEDQAINDKLRPYIHQGWITGTYLDQILLEGRVAMRNIQLNTPCNVFRCFGYLAFPVVTRNDYRPVLDYLSSHRFVDLAAKFQDIVNGRVPEFQDFTRGQAGEDFYLFLDHVEQRIAKLFRQFISQDLGSEIDVEDINWIEDAETIPGYLRNSEKYGSTYEAAFYNFEDQVLPDFFDGVEEVVGSATEEDFRTILPTPIENTLTFIPSRYSFTYIDLVEKELECVARDYVQAIDPRRHPMLYKVTQSLFEQIKGMDSCPWEHYLVTSDYKRLRLLKSPVHDQVYLVVKA